MGQGNDDLRKDGSEERDATADAIIQFPELEMKD